MKTITNPKQLPKEYSIPRAFVDYQSFPGRILANPHLNPQDEPEQEIDPRKLETEN